MGCNLPKICYRPITIDLYLYKKTDRHTHTHTHTHTQRGRKRERRDNSIGKMLKIGDSR